MDTIPLTLGFLFFRLDSQCARRVWEKWKGVNGIVSIMEEIQVTFSFSLACFFVSLETEKPKKRNEN